MQGDAVLDSVFKPVRPPTTFEETVERLGTAIRLGILPSGSRLPAERALADQLGISRSTLRHALRTLVQSGHLVSHRGRTGGTFVAERPPLSERDSRRLGAEAWAVLDYRVAIETGATLLAVERASNSRPPPCAAAGHRSSSVGANRSPAGTRSPISSVESQMPAPTAARAAAPAAVASTAPRCTTTPAVSAWKASSASSRVRPPSTRRTSTGTLSRTALTTSATRHAIASSAARATCPLRTPAVS